MGLAKRKDASIDLSRLVDGPQKVVVLEDGISSFLQLEAVEIWAYTADGYRLFSDTFRPGYAYPDNYRMLTEAFLLGKQAESKTLTGGYVQAVFDADVDGFVLNILFNALSPSSLWSWDLATASGFWVEDNWDVAEERINLRLWFPELNFKRNFYMFPRGITDGECYGTQREAGDGEIKE